MKTIFIKISSISLALLVLFSTFSFTVEKHYCGDFLMDVSYVGETVGCGMEEDTSSEVITKDCCKDEVHKIDGQDELQKSTVDVLDLKGQYFLASFLYTYKDLFQEKDSKKLLFKYFSPPDIPLNYQVLYQSFLI